MTKKVINVPVELINLKRQNALQTFRIKIRDRTHFYKIVNWLNDNIGKGPNLWTMEGHPLKRIKEGVPVNPEIYLFKETVDSESILFLSLI
jgi:hypothetical protein